MINKKILSFFRIVQKDRFSQEVFCLNTTQLECFLAVSNFLNFSRAAEQLRITQPAVSHQINTLEDELGVKLFHRTSKSVRLTQAGQMFIQFAGDMLRLADLSKTRLKEYQRSLPLRLGIGCRNMSELRLLRPALSRLRQEFPQLLPVLRLIPFDSLENLLEEGNIQVMLTTLENAPKKAVYQELVRCPVVCICSEGHPLAGHAQLTLSQLKEAGRIAACMPPAYPRGLFAIQNQIVSGRGTDQLLFCDNPEVMSTLVGAGFAFAVSMDLPYDRVPGLRYIPLPEFEPISYGAAYLPGEKAPALRRLLKLLAEVVPEGWT